MTSDPNSYIQASAEHLAQTLASKNSDYAPTGEFSNFEKAAEMANSRALVVMLSQIGIKMTRIQSLSQDVERPSAQYESLKDSLLDLAGYAVIAHAYLEYTGGHGEPSSESIEDRETIRNAMDDIHAHEWEHDWNKAQDICLSPGCDFVRGKWGNVSDHAHNTVVARGEMDEPLGYHICGICGVRRV